ncbi:hypothetical protein ACFSTH_17680 [Paenibacillus yanchengensis]|uniref:Uncharacterized protein n=1 Tax=Paenibacillus yanchengensis TaxID=2035833 RepID=A0ABW4YQV8_9BACL
MLNTNLPEALSEPDLVALMMLKSLGSGLGEGWLGNNFEKERSKQIFMMDFTFDPAYTDHLIVVYFDLDHNILTISHES